jgi:CRISPR-associated endonuclease Cas3-HD
MNSSSSSPELLAKSDPPVSLIDHCDTVAETTEQLLNTVVVEDRLDSIGVGSDLDLNRIQDLGYLAGRFHDVGKAHPDWQNACHTAIDGTDQQIQFPPHSARSALYAFAAARDRGLPPLQGIALTVAILHHHTPLTSERMRSEQIGDSVADLSQLMEMSKRLESAGFQDVEIGQRTRDSFLHAVSEQHSKSPREDDYQPIGMLVTLLRTALIQADHYASASAAGDTAPLPDVFEPTDLSLFDTLRPFQQQIDDTNDDRLVGLAGCGEGKTHSALQWGRRMIDNGRANRSRLTTSCYR